MSTWTPYDDTVCQRCGNTEGNRDHGPYEPHPLDAELGGTPPPWVHLMTCGSCGKCFDVAPDWYVEQQIERIAAEIEQESPRSWREDLEAL